MAKPGRRFWYLTEAVSAACCAVAEGVGFDLVGTEPRLPRLGVSALEEYLLTRPNSLNEDTPTRLQHLAQPQIPRCPDTKKVR